LDGAIVFFGKIEIGDADGVDVDVVRAQALTHVTLDTIPDGGALSDELLGVELRGLRLDGFLNGGNYHAILRVVVELGPDVGDAARIRIIGERDLGVDDLEIVAGGGRVGFFGNHLTG